MQEAWEDSEQRGRGGGGELPRLFHNETLAVTFSKVYQKKEKTVETGPFMPLCKLVKRMDFAFFWRMVAGGDSSCKRGA